MNNNTNNLTERNNFREAPALINGRYSLSKAELDLVMALMTNIDKDDQDFKDYSFTLKELEKKSGKEINSRQLKDLILNLWKKPLKIETEKGWEVFGFFSHFLYSNDGRITCRFDSKMKPYLLDLKHYVIGDYQQLLGIKSGYSKRIYMILKQYLKIGKRTIEVDELRDILQTPKSYKTYADFKRKVLEQATTDINAHTDIDIQYYEIKEGRKVAKIEFFIKLNDTPLYLKNLARFKIYIRANFLNKTIVTMSDGAVLSVCPKGLIYNKKSTETYTTQQSKLLWEMLFKLVKDKKLNVIKG